MSLSFFFFVHSLMVSSIVIQQLQFNMSHLFAHILMDIYIYIYNLHVNSLLVISFLNEN